MKQTRIQLGRLLVFVAVAKAGGFTAAANRLGTSKKLVSHQIHRLEAELGGALFFRTTRRVTLTAAGAELMLSCEPAFGDLAAAVDRFGAASVEVTGSLRITTIPEFAVSALGRVLAEFGRLHPRLRIELITSVEKLDLIAERIDVAVRVGWLRDSSLRSMKFGVFQQYVIAAPEYLARAGVPKEPEDLAIHRWVEASLLPTPLRLSFTGPRGSVRVVKLTSTMAGNAPPSVYALVRGGAGLSALPDFVVQRDIDSGGLVRVLSNWKLAEGGDHIVYPSTGEPPLKVRAFIDFFRAQSFASTTSTSASS
jgi:DNA-binding transcriptional LysR family regulator